MEEIIAGGLTEKVQWDAAARVRLRSNERFPRQCVDKKSISSL
jgi:hypothetical protein